MKTVVLALLSTLSFAQRWGVERSRLATILFGVSFIDQDYGIVTGGANGRGSAVFLTRDGGENYQLIPNQGQPPPGVSIFMSAHLASPTAAAAAGLCSWCFVTTGIEYMTDGTQFLLADDPAQGFPPVAAAQGGSAVPGARTPHFGFVGMWGLLDLDGNADVGIRHSTDAGVTWQRVPINYEHSNCRYMSMPAHTVWYVTCGTWPRATTSAQALRQNIIRYSQGLAVKFTNDSYVLEGAEAVPTDSTTGYSTAILKTQDAGRTWQIVYEWINGDYYLNNMDCFDVDNCYTVGDGLRLVGLRTNNGGRTWTEMDLGVRESGVSVMDIKFVNSREGFAAGGILTQQTFQGFILHTLDGGNTWSRQNIDNIYPVSLSLYTRRDGRTGGHGVGLTPDGQSSTIKYFYQE